MSDLTDPKNLTDLNKLVDADEARRAPSPTRNDPSPPSDRADRSVWREGASWRGGGYEFVEIREMGGMREIRRSSQKTWERGLEKRREVAGIRDLTDPKHLTDLNKPR